MLNIKHNNPEPLIKSNGSFNNFYNKHHLKNITFERSSKQINVNANK